MASHDQLNPHSAFNDQAFDDPYLSGPSDLEEFGLGQPQHTPSASSADNLSRLPSSSPADQNLSSDNQMDMFDFESSPFIGSDFNVPGSNGNLFLGMLSGANTDQIASFPNIDVGINTQDDFQMVGDGQFPTSAGNYSSRENTIGVDSSAHRPAQPPNLVIPNSPSDNHMGHNHTTSVPPLSPIVKISQVHRGDSPTRESDSGHKRNWSSAHLSPTLGSSEDDDESSQSVEMNHSERAYSPTRAEDGSWISNATTGHSGVDPYSRGDEWGPSPSELEERRQRAEKDSDIQKWSASVSIANSESGEEPPLRNSTGRGRSVSAVELRQDYFNLHQPDDFIQSGTNRFLDEASHRIDIEGDLNVFHEDSKDYTSEEHQLAQQLNPAYPWKDPARYPFPLVIESQPKTSSSAMQRFEEMAKELDNASRVGTWGSRRLNDVEVDSLLKSDSFFKNLSLNKTSILKLLPKRSSNSVKSKKRNSQHQNPEEEQSDQKPKKESGLAAKLSRRSSFNRPKSPTHVLAIAGQMAASIAGHKTLSVNSQVSSNRASLSPGPHWKGNRFRSKSEGSRTAPTLSPLAIPNSDQPQHSSLCKASPQVESRTSIGLDGDDDDDDDFADDKGVLMDSPSSSQQIQPTLDGFKRQITQLYSLLEPALLQRFASEQLSRYKKLVENQEEHSIMILTRSCNSGDRCFASGGDAKLLPPRANPKDSNATFCQFRISDNEHSGEEDGDLEHEDEQSIENAIQVAVFPINIPKPPVKRLPAEFECPLCFKVKKLQKPSDWTKHVFEDICPFTCTFAECTSVAKSFKRKADWVRHETECHRHLEWWTCNEHNCPHQCFRKNNFVKHLVREHGKPDPTAKKSKAATAASGSHNAAQIQELWQQVEECHFETDKKPEDEPCRFCGKVYKDWKHLMGHLASHMKRIALPVLRVAEERTSPAASTNHTADIHNVPSVAAAAPAISVYAKSEYDPNAGVLSELDDDQISEDLMTSSMQSATLSKFDGHHQQSSNMYSGGAMRMDLSPGGTTYPPASATFYLQPHYVPQQRNSMSYPPSPVSNSMEIGQTTVAIPGGNNNHLSQAAIYNHQGQSMLANSTTICLNDSREVLYQSPQDTNFNPEDHFPPSTTTTTTSSAVGYASTHNINYPVSTSMQTVNTMVAVNHSVYMPQTLMVSQIQDDNNRYASAKYPYQ